MQIENKFYQGFRAFGKGLVEHSKQLDNWVSCRYMQSIAFKLTTVLGGDTVETNTGAELLQALHKAAKAGKLTLDEVETVAKQLDAISLRFDYFNTAYWLSIKIEEKSLTAAVEEDKIVDVVETPVVVETTEAEQKPKAGRKPAAKGK